MFFHYWELATIMEFMLLVSVSMKEYNCDEENCYDITRNTFGWHNDNTRNHNSQLITRNQHIRANQEAYSQSYQYRSEVGRKTVENIKNLSIRNIRRMDGTTQNPRRNDVRSINQSEKFNRDDLNRRLQRRDERIMRVSEDIERKYRYQKNSEQIRYNDQRRYKQTDAGNRKTDTRTIQHYHNGDILQRTIKINTNELGFSNRNGASIAVDKHRVRLERQEIMHKLIDLNIRERHDIPIQTFRLLQSTKHNFASLKFNGFYNIHATKLLREQPREGNMTIINNDIVFSNKISPTIQDDLITRKLSEQHEHRQIIPINAERRQSKFAQSHLSSEKFQDYRRKAKRNLNYYVRTSNADCDFKMTKTRGLRHLNLGAYEDIHTINGVHDKTKLHLQNTEHLEVLKKHSNPDKHIQYRKKIRLANKNTDKGQSNISMNKQRTLLSIKRDNYPHFTGHCRALLNYYQGAIIRTILLSFILMKTARGTEKLKNHILQQLKQFLPIWHI